MNWKQEISNIWNTVARPMLDSIFLPMQAKGYTTRPLLLPTSQRGNRKSIFLEALRASQALHVTSVLSFPNANKKSVLQSLKGWVMTWHQGHLKGHCLNSCVVNICVWSTTADLAYGCLYTKGAFWPWHKVKSLLGGQDYIACMLKGYPSHNISLLSLILIIFHTFVIDDPRICCSTQ